MRWVKHFEAEYCDHLSGKINEWLARNSYATIVGISVYPVTTVSKTFFGAEVILEKVGDER